MRLMIGLVILLVLFGVLAALASQTSQILLVVSGSMKPTLQIGDRILVDSNTYADRYDIVVIQDPEKPKQPDEKLIKRIIGVEGDTIEIRGGIIYVNGKEQYSRHVASNRINWGDFRLRVPDDSIYAIGDNRNDSYDSLNFGPVKRQSIKGVLWLIIWPPNDWGAPSDFLD